MINQTTHQEDEYGIMRQIVSPEVLRQLLDAASHNYSRPDDFGPVDEWIVEYEWIVE